MVVKTIPTLVAHRGYPSRYPENTLLGIKAAVQAGARWFEFDVQLSKDHVPYLCHDDTLERTAGDRRSIFDLNSRELREIDVGERARFGARFTGTPPTPLMDLAEWLKEQPGARAFVEIKAESLEHFGHALVVKQVMGAVQPVLERCVIISFDAPCLKLARQLGAGPVGWALEDASPRTVKMAAEFKPEYLFVGDALFAEAHVALNGPWKWAVYQVQDPDYAVKLTEQGADLVETDAVGEMLAAFTPKPA
ncbi:MAG: glycerophosphodiester phosphodiesterase family protein [Bacillota bacterium]